MRDKILYTVLGILAGTVLGLALAAYGVSMPGFGRSDDATNNDPPQNAPGRVARTVSGTDWKYTVSQDYEKKFVLTVSKGSGNSELTINGHGCNMMSADIITDVNDPRSNGDKRTINGKTYYLAYGPSTLIACVGDAANDDQLLQDEIRAVFASLHT